jgi:esterase/lipase superfamily enzyme
LLVLIAVCAAAGIGSSQSLQDVRLPEACRAEPAEGLAALEKRKDTLEREIKAHAKDNTTALRKSQEELLEVVFKVDCIKMKERVAAAAAAKPAPSTGGTDASGSTRGLRKIGGENVIEVTTYYATNRALSGQTEATRVYEAKRAALSYGRATVSVPKAHVSGNLELPSIWRLQFQPDPERHFMLKDAKPLANAAAFEEMKKGLADAKSKALLVYVHGYNMSFAETAMRSAQLAYDLNFPGIPFFFSWPSAARASGYLQDEETAQLSRKAFDQVLDDLGQLPVDEVYIIAHSMGSRIVSEVLGSRVEKGKPTAHLRELLLAAPDINAELFTTEIAPKLALMRGIQTTVYASSSDLALIASKFVHGYSRVGETADGVFVHPGMDTIDASRASLAMRAFGHSYLTDSAEVLKDIGSMLRQKLSAKQRGLPEAGSSPNVYWSLP